MTVRMLVAIPALLALCALLALPAGEAPRSAPQAVESGLGWLRGQQQGDGGLSGKHRTAVTGLAALAHLAAGLTPNLPEHGTAVRRMLAFLVGRADAQGYFGGDGSRMYGHAIVCLALADALGSGRDDDLDERLRQALARGIAVIVAAAQVGKPDSHRGGWRYNPTEVTSDVSVSGWQVMALHAARRLGLEVPEPVWRGGLDYIHGRIGADGKVGYHSRDEDRPALRGLALMALDLRGPGRDPLRDGVLARLRKEPTTWTGPWFFYRAYYDAVGLSRSEPAAWAEYRGPLIDLLVANQGANGAWPAPPGDNERDHGAAYATAMALLALTVDLRLLPSHQP